ncbi:MAG: hypothetical protein WCW13_02980 [archaeon]|jgi:hypothetical protein
MIYAPRKLVYPFFVVIFLIAFLSVLYLVALSQSIEVNNPSVSILGSDVVVKMNLKNKSMHAVDEIKVVVKSNSEERSFYIKGGSLQSSSLDAGESYDFVALMPLTENTKYTVNVSAPFNKPISIDFALEESTIDPVKAEVSIPSEIKLNEKIDYVVKFCNVSGTDLPEVIWLERAEEGVFKEVFFERSIALKVSECKSIHSILTPAKLGQVTIGFTMTIGSIEKKSSKILNVVE